jgi:hypothetical protein
MYPYGGWDPLLGGYRPVPRDGALAERLPSQDGWDPIVGGYRPKAMALDPVLPDVENGVVPSSDSDEERRDRIEGP